MKKSYLLGAVCAVVSVLVTMTANAALIGVLPETPGGTDWQAYYDDVADLTWLADANAAGGTMNWTNANTWATSLDIDGITGWRLPDTLQPDSSCSYPHSSGDWGYNCTGSELGNMFYNVLGGTADQSITTSHNSNYDLFSNIQPYYWSSTLLSFPTSAWYFDLSIGVQDIDSKNDEWPFAWAVQSGNVGAVPIPASVWLFGSGLLGLIGIAKRKRMNNET